MAGIGKAFGGVPALIGVTLAIQPAEIIGLIGQTGAGKSTIIKILNGAHPRDGGAITFDDRPWTALSPLSYSQIFGQFSG